MALQSIPLVNFCQENFFPMANASDFPNQLRRFRELIGGKTQRDFACELGVAANSVSKVKRARVIPEKWYENAYNRKGGLRPWLEHGLGQPAVNIHEEVRQLSPPLRQVVDHGKRLDDSCQKALAMFAELLEVGQPMHYTWIIEWLHRFVPSIRPTSEGHNPPLLEILPPPEAGPGMESTLGEISD